MLTVTVSNHLDETVLLGWQLVPSYGTALALLTKLVLLLRYFGQIVSPLHLCRYERVC